MTDNKSRRTVIQQLNSRNHSEEEPLRMIEEFASDFGRFVRQGICMVYKQGFLCYNNISRHGSM